MASDQAHLAAIWKDRDVAAAFLQERSLFIPDRERQLEVTLRALRFLKTEPRRVLDLGTGSGAILGTVLSAWPKATGVGVDFSPLMLEQARQSLAVFGDRVTLFEADLGSPTWRNQLAGPFDAIVSGFCIHHLPHERKRSLYAEIYELLSPQGLFANMEHVASASAVGEDMYNEAMIEHLYRRRKENGEDVTLEQVGHDFLTRPDRAANILAPVEEQCRWLCDIGFREVDCFWKYYELAVFGGVK